MGVQQVASVQPRASKQTFSGGPAGASHQKHLKQPNFDPNACANFPCKKQALSCVYEAILLTCVGHASWLAACRIVAAASIHAHLICWSSERLDPTLDFEIINTQSGEQHLIVIFIEHIAGLLLSSRVPNCQSKQGGLSPQATPGPTFTNPNSAQL